VKQVRLFFGGLLGAQHRYDRCVQVCKSLLNQQDKNWLNKRNTYTERSKGALLTIRVFKAPLKKVEIKTGKLKSQTQVC
jgi:hypothetical protein